MATPAVARFPLRVKALLEEGLALRDRYATQAISLHALWTATGRLEVKLDRVLARRYRAGQPQAKHLHERPYLFTFLYCPGLDATNNAAERAIRALGGARKNWGGNRTPNGARAQAVLTNLLQTAREQGKTRSTSWSNYSVAASGTRFSTSQLADPPGMDSQILQSR